MPNTYAHHHSLEGNNPPRGTDYMAHAPPANQGIVDGRPEGRQPQASPVLLDTVVDQDASADNGTDYLTARSFTLGVTSRGVHKGLGVPAQGMSSKELRHDGQPVRKRHGGCVEQFGEGVAGESGGDNVAVGGTSESRWVAGKTEFRESS